jgi:N-acetylmuramoyl-L-alanine amidase
MNYQEKLLPEGCKARPGIPLGKITALTVHWTGPYPKQDITTPRQWWIDSKGEAAAHFIIKDGDCICTVPVTEVAYHCGNSTGNRSSIGIEVIPADETGVFSEASVETLKELIQRWPGVPLRRHFDWSGKDCPKYYTPLAENGTANWMELLVKLGRM